MRVTDNQQIQLAGSIATDQVWWAKRLDEFNRMLPERMKHIITAPSFAVVVQKQLEHTPALRDCTLLSWLAALYQCARLALLPGGSDGQAWLIPFKDQCTFVPGYMGLIDLMGREGIHCQSGAVFTGDKFEFSRGTERRLVHVPSLNGDRESAGRLKATWALLRYPDGFEDAFVSGIGEIEKRRKASSAVRSGRPTPWDSWYVPMAMRVPVRNAYKSVPDYIGGQAGLTRGLAAWDEKRELGLELAESEKPAFIAESEADARTVMSELPSKPQPASKPETAQAPEVPADGWQPRNPEKDKNIIIGKRAFTAVEERRTKSGPVYWIRESAGDMYSTFNSTLRGTIAGLLDREVLAAWTERKAATKTYLNLVAVKTIEDDQNFDPNDELNEQEPEI